MWLTWKNRREQKKIWNDSNPDVDFLSPARSLLRTMTQRNFKIHFSLFDFLYIRLTVAFSAPYFYHQSHRLLNNGFSLEKLKWHLRFFFAKSLKTNNGNCDFPRNLNDILKIMIIICMNLPRNWKFHRVAVWGPCLFSVWREDKFFQRLVRNVEIFQR